MFFATTRPATLRRAAYVPAMHALDRLLDQALPSPSEGTKACRTEVTSDDAVWTLSLDVPGVNKEQLNIQIEGQVVRTETPADAPRQYRHGIELPQDIGFIAHVRDSEGNTIGLHAKSR